MSEEIFISHKSERRAAAQHFATVLKHHGFSVWYDYSLVKGRDFGLQIDSKIRGAKALVCLWCSKAVGSRWVAEEVDLAHELGVLIPVKIEACDLPVGFRRADYIDLSGWDGAPRGAQIDSLIDELEKRIGRPAVLDRAAIREYEKTWRTFGAPSLRAFGLAAVEMEEPRVAQPETKTLFPSQAQITLLNPYAVLAARAERLSQAAMQVLQNPLAAGGYEDRKKRLIRGFGMLEHSYVKALAFSVDGKTIISGNSDYTIIL